MWPSFQLSPIFQTLILALVAILLLNKGMAEDVSPLSFYYFPPIKLKTNDATGDKRGRMRAKKHRSDQYMANVFVPESEKLSFKHVSHQKKLATFLKTNHTWKDGSTLERHVLLGKWDILAEIGHSCFNKHQYVDKAICSRPIFLLRTLLPRLSPVA